MRPAAALSNVPIRFLECRDTNHEWKRNWWRMGRRELVCTRCGTKKVQILFATHGFKIENSHYDYPKGYLIKSAVDLDIAYQVRAILWDVVRNNGHRNGHRNGNGRK